MCIERLKRAIDSQQNIAKLKTMRDTGLDILINSGYDTITLEDKTELVTYINNRIVELGGTI